MGLGVADYVILLIVAAAFVAAVIVMARKRRRGESSCAECSEGCSGNCDSCAISSKNRCGKPGISHTSPDRDD